MNTIKEPTQQELDAFVRNNIGWCQSMLVDALLQKEDSLISFENITNYFPQDEDGNQDEDGEYPEIFEWWLVDKWMARKLEEQGECILRSDYGLWWGRTGTGQAIFMDSVIAAIWKSLQ